MSLDDEGEVVMSWATTRTKTSWVVAVIGR